jgi:hypothetical protein
VQTSLHFWQHTDAEKSVYPLFYPKASPGSWRPTGMMPKACQKSCEGTGIVPKACPNFAEGTGIIPDPSAKSKLLTGIKRYNLLKINQLNHINKYK